MSALEKLKAQLAATLSLLKSGGATANALKDHWWQICHAMKPAIAELRQNEPPQPHWTDKRKAAKDGVGVG